MVWQVLDGSNISIWNDSWVAGLKEKKLKDPSLVDQNIPENVVDIMDKVNGVWDLSRIEEWIFVEEKKAIEVMPIGENEGEDKMIWPHNAQSVYTVKSSYQILKQERMVWDRRIVDRHHPPIVLIEGMEFNLVYEST